MLGRTVPDKDCGRPRLECFGVIRRNPGYLYIIEDGNRFKIGKTINPSKRIREAKTWIPDIKVVGVKPFWDVGRLERLLHCGLAQFWKGGEWFEFPDDTYEFLYAGFNEFYDGDQDWNSVDFIYWYNSSGMGELVMEQNSRKISVKKFLQQESGW